MVHFCPLDCCSWKLPNYMFKIRKGLNLPISGVPEQHVSTGVSVRHVAILGDDYLGMRPSMLVQEGDRVIKGQALFEDKKNPGVMFTAPACGTIVAINRGERRVMQSVVIRIEGDEQRTFAHVYLNDPPPHSEQREDHRADGDHRLAGDRGRSAASCLCL